MRGWAVAAGFLSTLTCVVLMCVLVGLSLPWIMVAALIVILIAVVIGVLAMLASILP